MASTLDKSPVKGERIRRRWSSWSVVVILFAGLTPALVMTRVIGPHEEWPFWGYVAHVTVLTLSPATAIGLIRLLERWLRRPAIAVAVARRLGRDPGGPESTPVADTPRSGRISDTP